MKACAVPREMERVNNTAVHILLYAAAAAFLVSIQIDVEETMFLVSPTY